MSQQSTLKMMLPYFEKWMKRFPTLASLANAQEEALLKYWEGLGYYSRARNIHKGAKILQKHFPQNPEDLQKIPGIGPYTSAAIASIAFDYPAIAIDGNVTRVFSRYFGIENPFGIKEDAKNIQMQAQLIAQSIPAGSRGNITQALMELGATVCRPLGQAKCFECPISKECVALKLGKVALWPMPKSRPQMQKVMRLLLIYRNSAGNVFIRQRPQTGSLGGQWEIPYLDIEATDQELLSLFSPHFEVAKPFKHTIMSKSFSVWPLELGTGPRSTEGSAYLGPHFKGVLSTMSRKFLARASG